MLAISVERLEYVINKAREFDAEVPVAPDAESGPDAPDHDEREALLDTPENPAEQELRDAIDSLGAAERQELLALMWLGRGDYETEEWPEALRQAGETADVNLTDHLMATPLLGDYLEEGASALDLALGDVDRR